MAVISHQGQINVNKTTTGNTIFVNPNAGQTGVSPLGGGQRWPDKFYRWFKRGNATEDYKTRKIVVAAGQVLKKGTILQSLPNGQMTAHGVATQNNTVLLSGTMSAGDTLKINGMTYTAAQPSTPLQVAQIWEAWAQINSAGYPVEEFNASMAGNTLLQPSNGVFSSAYGTGASAWIPGWNFVVDLATVAENTTTATTTPVPVTLSANISNASTGTLSAAWAYPTGNYTVEFETAAGVTNLTATFTNGSTAISNISSAVTTTATAATVVVVLSGTVGLVAESQGFVAPTTALAAPTYTGSTLTVSLATAIGTSVSGTSFIQLSGTLASTATVVVGGVTFTAAAATATAAQIAAAISLVGSGINAGTLTVGSSTTNAAMLATNGVIGYVNAGAVYNASGTQIGTLSGTNTGWNFSVGANSGAISAVATPLNSVGGVLIASTGTGITLQASAQNTSNPVAGILLFDVNANTNTGTLANPVWTPTPTAAAMYIDGDFYAEGLVWENHPVPNVNLVPNAGYITSPAGAGFTGQTSGYDYVVNADGTATACTPYWTGVQTLLDAQKMFENTVGSSWFTLGSWQERAGEIEP